jgi:malate/lactate dehydrogenase
MKKAGVIGGSGFIESDIISLLLHKQFDVKVSTEDISKKENYQHLMELEHAEHLYVCEITSNSQSDIQQFTKDCDFVVFVNPSDIKSCIS